MIDCVKVIVEIVLCGLVYISLLCEVLCEFCLVNELSVLVVMRVFVFGIDMVFF